MNQNYALNDCYNPISSVYLHMNYEPPYASSYIFKLVAKFKEHPNLDAGMFVYYMDAFMIRDYCVGMTL